MKNWSRARVRSRSRVELYERSAMARVSEP